MLKEHTYVLDIETFSNLFVAVARKLGTKDYLTFIVHESQDDFELFLTWLKTKPNIIGYNVLEFDGQVIEYMHRSPEPLKAEQIYKFAQDLINRPPEDRFNLPYSEWDLSFKYIDLFKINHYDNANRRTSLKWLEYTTRAIKVVDMPAHHEESISKSKVPDVVRYCKDDVDFTFDFFQRCLSMIQLRYNLIEQYKDPRIMNMSDSSIGSYIFENILTKKYGFKKETLKRGTYYDRIHVKDCLLDYIGFEDEGLKKVHENFKTMVMEDVRNQGIKGEAYSQSAMFEDMVFVYGSGGVHACYKAGEYVATDDMLIMSVDVSSYYPNLAIANNFFPKHIGKEFCTIYKDVYNERQTHPKGSAMNYAYKIALNSVYGKSNSAYSAFFDPQYTLKITINGQLLLTMLAEALAKLGRLLMVNTDGIEIMIPKDKLDELNDICSEWESLTGLSLEQNQYNKLVIRDVNNYLAIDVKNKAKRKGIFEIYYDFTEEDDKPHQYHKSPDAMIIPQALYDYYMEDKSIEDTINNCNDIYEFLFGIKKKSNFDYWLITATNGIVDIEKRSDRVLRYFISKEGANIFKFFKDGRKTDITGVNRGQLVKLAMRITNKEIIRMKGGTKKTPGTLVEQYDLDKDYYIQECYKIIDIINTGTRDNAYLEYVKEQEKLKKNE